MSRSRMIIRELLTSLVVMAMIGLTAGLVKTASANMAYVPRPLEKAVRAAEIVAHVRVSRITATPCGTDYSVDVLKTYRGKTERSLTFATRRSPISPRDREVSRGDELLVLLSTRSPAQEPYGDCCTDAPARTPPKAELQCRAALSNLTPVLNFESAFLLEKRGDTPGVAPSVWFWYDRLRTEPPANILPKDPRSLVAGKCTGLICSVRWKTVEPQIREWAKKVAPNDK